MALWDDVKRNLGEWYGAAAEKTSELTRVGVRRYDIFGLSRDIERQFVEMGSLVYNALNEGRTDLHEDEVLQGLVERVRGLETELKAKEDEIQEIRHAARAAAGAAAEPGAAEEAETEAEVEVDVYEMESADEPESEDEEKR